MVIEAYKYLENVDNTNHQRSSSPNCASVDSRKRQISYAGRSESPKKQRVNASTKSVSESQNNGKNDGNDVLVIQADSSSTNERREKCFVSKFLHIFFSAEKDENIEEIQFYTGGDPEIKIETVGTISNEFNDGNAVEVSLCYRL